MSTTLSALRTALLLAASFAPAAAQQPPAPDDGAAPPPQPQRGPADPSEDAFRFGSPPALPEGTTQEQMWPSATAEQWAQPCLVTWQRTFDDALKVANARHQPILVAVNMDGEIASEHFAGVRYREPETAARMSRYACVIASVYRHTPRDYDPDGKRVECPRFGTVTCGEHIEAERELYDKYFDGKRISPRHIVLDLDGGETYDVYFSWDTDTVFKEFVAGVEGWPEPLPPAEPTIENLARSAAVDDRLRLERTYAEADRETKRAILVALCEPAAVDQLEVLRAALFGFDLELAKLGRRALATCETDGALDLMAEALKVPLEADEREALLGAVERLSATLPRARTLAALHRGLAQGSRLVAPAGTPESFAREYEANAAALGLARRADAVEAAPAEPAALLELAEAYLDRALRREDRFALVNLQDAQRMAARAQELGAQGPRLEAVLAGVADELGDSAAATAHALAAVEGGLLAPAGDAPAADAPTSDVVRERVLELFGAERQRAIRAAFRAGEPWPPEWLADVNAAYGVLAASPRTDEDALLEHYDFLRWIGASERAGEVLELALARFPDAPRLHERLRGRLLWQGGPEELERVYAERLARRADPATDASQLAWFAGYAELVAAEHYRRRSRFEPALDAYERGLARFAEHAARFPESRDDDLHYQALAHAGRARVRMERGELADATRELLRALELRADSAASPDGLGITPLATATMLQAKLNEAGDAERAAALQGALDALDPRLLEPLPSERFGRGRRGPRGGR